MNNVRQTIVEALRRTEGPRLSTTERRHLGAAARMLDEHAAEIHRSYTMPGPPRQWTEHDAVHRKAHRDHDKLRRLASALRVMTRINRRT